MTPLNDQQQRIERAAPFIDRPWDGNGWKPSELLTIGYCVLRSGRNPASADAWLDERLEEERQRFREDLL